MGGSVGWTAGDKQQQAPSGACRHQHAAVKRGGGREYGQDLDSSC